MQELEDYLRGDFHLDQSEIETVDQALTRIVKIFVDHFDEQVAWPYRVPLPSNRKQTRLSHSTTSMTLAALTRLVGELPVGVPDKEGSYTASYFPRIPLHDKLQEQLLGRIESAASLLIKDVFLTDDPQSKFQTQSDTYGTDDVFTYAWLADLVHVPWTDHQDRWQRIRDEVLKRSKDRIRDFPKDGVFLKPKKSNALPHALPALRLIQTIRRIEGSAAGPEPAYKHFETALHDQLSYSSIPDSRFDPAEAMFCLEGLLHCQANVVDRSLFNRVLEVLTTAQRDSAYWRPVKPLLATIQGYALFPVSVEVANSLLRAMAIYDAGELYDTYGAQCIALLKRYWQWLRARTVHLKGDGGDYVGWNSEHVDDTRGIQLWETSQVVEFLLGYRSALQAHIARTTLVRSQFKINPIPAAQWSRQVTEEEPVTGLGEPLKVLAAIGKNFIGSADEPPEHYSMLLYGPPGTGKTTIAKNVAAAMKRPLITITVSDFLAGGGDLIESRAKNIFDVLVAQGGAVILFDEIDHLLLDRDSPQYNQQQTTFQFMTPGMLTKITALREAKGSVFIIATNYEERIDAAIKRPGRIDAKYLVLPPDSVRREAILKSQLEKRYGSHFRDSSAIWDWKLLSQVSLFLGKKDLEMAVGQFPRKSPPDFDTLHGVLKDMPRTISLQAYLSRFENPNYPKKPIDEFFALLALQLEAGTGFSDHRELLNKVVTALIENVVNTITVDSLHSHVPSVPISWLERVVNELNAVEKEK